MDRQHDQDVDREMRVVAQQLATREAFTAFSKAEQERVLGIVYWQKNASSFAAASRQRGRSNAPSGKR